MTLRRKMSLQLGAMLLGPLLVIATGLWGLNGQRVDFGVAASGYRQLRSIYEIAGHVATAKTFLRAGSRDQASNEVDAAAARLDIFSTEEQAAGDATAIRFADTLKREIGDSSRLLRRGATDNPPTVRQQLDALDLVLGHVTGFALSVRSSITSHEDAAHHRWLATLILMLVVSAAVVAIALLLSVRQYRSVINPLRRLREAADRFAAGKFDERLDEAAASHHGSEFATLAGDFNRMARELQSLYDDLERQVEIKSRELVRSERLASVGYLAAGIAHEINNPLGIITGYAERTIRSLQRSQSDSANELAIRNLKVVCDEAYRCKAITDRLLSLVRPGEEQHKPVELNALIQEVATLVQGLPLWHRQNVRLVVEPGEQAVTVLAAAAELKQVLLNLLINACEAQATQVVLTLVAVQQSARIIVSDNGRGMDASTLEHIFEPFFTEKRGSGVGTGLGLSISHAIIESHSGRITASSAGIECGSKFVVELPVMEEAVARSSTLRKM